MREARVARRAWRAGLGKKAAASSVRIMLAAAAALSLCFVGAFALLSRIAPALPAPSGSFPVGTTSLNVRHPGTGNVGPADFIVQLWYPAVRSSERAPYGTGDGGLKSRLYHWILRTYASPNAVPVASPARFPLLLYVAGWGGRRTENTVLFEDLASHGYVIAALDDAGFETPATGHMNESASFSSGQAFRRTIALGNEKIDYEARRASLALDYLLKPFSSAGILAGRIDTSRVGILGFSLGGAVALAASRRDPRFRAAMNLDGYIFDAGRDGAALRPYFLVSDANPLPDERSLASSDPTIRYRAQMDIADDKEQRRALQSSGGYLLQVAGADHLSFTDARLYAPWQRLTASGIDPQKASRAMNSYALAFFDKFVNGRRPALLEPGSVASPELQLERFPAAVSVQLQ